MKKFLLACVCTSFFLMSTTTEAQILNKIKDKVKQSAENRVVNKAENATERSMDKIEEGTKGRKSERAENEDFVESGETQTTANKPTGGKEKQEEATLTSYSNYDFVPGDKLIYFYDMAGEADSEIPGRMLIDDGTVEVQTYKGEKVLFVPADTRLHFHPDVKDNAYLPEQYTIEFDILSNGGIETTLDGSEFTLYLREKESASGDRGNAVAPIRVFLTRISGTDSFYGFESSDKNENVKGTHYQPFAKPAINSKQNSWRKVTIYVNKNIGKLYIDQHRIGTINQITPSYAAYLDMEINTSDHPVMLKNFRIAAGGADSYNKIVTDGKFIAYGIQFDVNKSTLKPESMGTINEFVKMMKEKPELKFEIGGHTDSDGTAERNNALSQERADAVKAQMVKMGIAADRLTTKGFGTSKSIADNNSPENKAKNRRVEFVKL